jgi:hypothetical protein
MSAEKSETVTVPASLVERFNQMELKQAELGRTLGETIRQLEEKTRENDELKKQMAKAKSRAEAQRLSQRRVSMGLPSSLTTSSLTEPAFTSPLRARVRSSVGFRHQPLMDDVGDDGDESKSEESEDESDSAPVRRSQGLAQSRSERESKIVWKALAGMKAPDKFTGETNTEKNRVEQWVTSINNYLDGKFRGVDAPRERMVVVQSFLGGPALDWVQSMYGDGAIESWDEMWPLLIDYIRGSRDSKEQARVDMRVISFGKGKCRPGDLLSYNTEYESLRVKLYSSASTNREVNERAADDYLQGIHRGHPELYIEILRCLSRSGGPGASPTLSEAKEAASTAWGILRVVKEQVKNQSAFTPSSSRSSRPSQHSTSSQSTVNNVGVDRVDGSDDETWERQEGEAEEPASVQTVNTRRPNNRPTGGDQAGQPQRGYQLSDAQREQLGKLGRCFRCYGKGHKSWEKACPAKGKPQRAPTAEQLKA